jgi:hypothetical protein
VVRCPVRLRNNLAPVTLKVLPNVTGSSLFSMDAPILLRTFTLVFVCITFAC